MIRTLAALVRWALFTLLIATAVHFAAVAWMPSLLMSRAVAKIGALSGINAIAFAPPATDTARTIVRPSPDLLYSACPFDLTQHNLHVRVPIPKDGYWSLALYGGNADAFLVTGNRGAGVKDTFEALLVGPGAVVDDTHGLAIVRAPSFTGILLIRRLIDSSSLAGEDAVRRAAICEALPR